MGKRSRWLWWMVVAVGVVGVVATGTKSGAGEGEGKGKVLEPLVTRIAFGSCANQSAPQVIVSSNFIFFFSFSSSFDTSLHITYR